MSKFILYVICIFISVSVTAETVYKKKNKEGAVEFTDQKSTDSEEIKIRESTTYKPIGLPALSLPSKKLSPTFNYDLAITQPANDATLTGQANVTVSISVQPALQSGYGHQIRYQLGDQPILSQNNSVTFNNVPRGTQNVTVSVIDKNGEIVSPVASSTFHMKRFFKKPVPPKPKPKVP